MTLAEVLQAISGQSWTASEAQQIKAAANAMSVALPPPGISPEGFQIPRDGLTIVSAQGKFALDATADANGYRRVIIDGQSIPMYVQSAEVKGGQIVYTQGATKGRWDWGSRSGVRWP